MKTKRRRITKTLLIITGILVAAIAIIIIFISPIAKYLIEKYDEKYTGRQITLDWIYVNPFTGYLYVKNLKINEANSEAVFFSANGIGLNISMNKLFSKDIEITEFTV